MINVALGSLSLSHTSTVMILAFAAYAIIYLALPQIGQALKQLGVTSRLAPTPQAPKAFKVASNNNDDDVVEPLPSLDVASLSKIDPIKYRPYKTQGHVTMGIQKRTRNEWIRMDNGYLDRIAERKPLIQEKPEFTVGTGPLVDEAIEELYTEIMINYLPNRYPSIFQTKGNNVYNALTKETYPLSTSGLKPARMLELLGYHVEEDFYFMMPDADDGEFRLRGYIACFPGGFLSPARVGESVREIHQPVPGYEERLGKSVDRYFARMEPGQFIGRMNWSLQVDGKDLFRKDGNNFYPEKGEEISGKKHDPILDECFLRVEHQTLVALPKTRAIMFCVRSYMTSLHKIKADGEGPALAAAIKSMPEKLGDYKMRPFWESKILPWLDGATDE